MKDKRFAAYMTAMCTFGLVTMVALGLLVEWRENRSVLISDQPESYQDEPAIEVLLAGSINAANTAASEMDGGSRADAMEALDGGLRVTQVGQHVTVGRLNWAFDHAQLELRDAKNAVQIGQPEEAIEHLRRAAEALSEMRGEASEFRRQQPSDFSGYEGALLLNAAGSRIGEVASLSDDTATLRLGGSPDFLGIFNFGGHTETVPIDMLLLGERRTIGGTQVVLATLG